MWTVKPLFEFCGRAATGVCLPARVAAGQAGSAAAIRAGAVFGDRRSASIREATVDNVLKHMLEYIA
ncbi:hypothetical protein GCM10010317_053420 [Streptomyces mirabilis]|nr:hypothetical protein GCM10010317_053420 [Streptomyces mirabilis]